MATRIIVPHLGESIVSARLLSWEKGIGDEVSRGDELAIIETDKATMPLEAPANGVVLALVVDEGTDVHIGQLLGVIGQAGEEWHLEQEQEEQAGVVSQEEMAAAAEQRSNEKRSDRVRRRVSPLARRRAQELGIDIASVEPTGGSRVKAEDVERYAAQGALAPSHEVDLSGLKQIVGGRMLKSWQSIPQFSVSVKADATKLIGTRGDLGITALLVHFVAQALRKHPLLNSKYSHDRLTVYDVSNIGVAVATPDGLRVPVVPRAEQLTVRQVDSRVQDLAARAREGCLGEDDVANGTFTITNLGMYGVSQFVPIVNPPQVAILGVGQPFTFITPDNEGAWRPVKLMDLTVSADHRALDGAEVAEFLYTLKALIEACTVA